nr:MAG TPA: hypothetical protein [Caudoviricetes sp.]
MDEKEIKATPEVTDETQKKGKAGQRFDGETIVKSKRWRQYADLLCIELEEDKLYTATEVDAIIETALMRPVEKVINE